MSPEWLLWMWRAIQLLVNGEKLWWIWERPLHQCVDFSGFLHMAPPWRRLPFFRWFLRQAIPMVFGYKMGPLRPVTCCWRTGRSWRKAPITSRQRCLGFPRFRAEGLADLRQRRLVGIPLGLHLTNWDKLRLATGRSAQRKTQRNSHIAQKKIKRSDLRCIVCSSFQ